MSSVEETDTAIPLSWIVIFLLLSLGLGAAAILFVGGEIVAPSQFLVPSLF